MEKILRRIIGISFVGVMFSLTPFSVFGQMTPVEPGDASINASLLNTGQFTWELREESVSAGSAKVMVERNSREIKIVKRITSKNLEEREVISILNPKTLETIRKSYKDDIKIEDVEYGTSLRGSQTYPSTGKKNVIAAPLNGKKFFDEETLPFVVSLLPLSPGYQASLPYYSHDFWTFKPKFSQLKIVDITEHKIHSCVTGARDIWLVKAKGDGYNFEFRIDKATRRILYSDVPTARVIIRGSFSSRDHEADINPIKTPFNAAEANAMIKGGSASIQGQVWTRAGSPGSNKKQYAPKGTIVMLIPITPYFRELYNFNLQNLRNSDRCGLVQAVPEVKNETLVTDVTDGKGNFVFQGLKPGEFWITTTFVATKYSKTTKTLTGYTITVDEQGIGSVSPNIDVRHWGDKGDFASFKVVKVTKEGETVKLKLDN